MQYAKTTAALTVQHKHPMPDLFDELKEDFRQERYLKLLNQYGHYLLGAVAGVIVLTALIIWWQSALQNRRAEAGSAYHNAYRLLQQNNTDAALTAFTTLSEEASGGYQELAQLHRAALLTGAPDAPSSDPEAALTAYSTLAEDSGIDTGLRHLAMLHMARLHIAQKNYAEAEPLLNRLKEQDAPWRFAAQELLALSLIEQQRHEEATATLTLLRAAPGAPATLRARADTLLQQLPTPITTPTAEDAP